MNKKIIKTLMCLSCGLGIASSIPFITTSCAQKDKALPDDVYKFDETDNTKLLGFTEIFLANTNKYKDCNTMLIPTNFTYIAEFAFVNQSTYTSFIPTYIKKVSLPYSIEEIEDNAFALSKIENISIDEKNENYGLATNLGKKSQVLVPKNNCKWTNNSLAPVGALATGEVDFRVDSDITEINEYAFGSTNIVKVHLSKNIESIGEDAFAGCPIKDFSIEKNDNYGIATNLGSKCKVLVSTINTKREWAWVNTASDFGTQCIAEGSLAIGDVVFPKSDDSIQRIAMSAFYSTNVNSINFSSSINYIRQDNSYMHNLKELTFNGSSIFFGSSSFNYCYNLKKITWNGLSTDPTIECGSSGVFESIPKKGKIVSTSKNYSSQQLLDYLNKTIQYIDDDKTIKPFQNWEAA